MPYKDPEKRRAYGREWIRRNPEKAREAMRRWRRRHPDEHNHDGRTHYARHREEIAARKAAYRRQHPEVRQTAHQRRRSRLAGAIGSYTSAEWRALVAAFNGCCAYCGVSGPLDADHCIPLARGGTNNIGNILPACASCNHRKHTLTEAEFRARMAREASKLKKLAG